MTLNITQPETEEGNLTSDNSDELNASSNTNQSTDDSNELFA